MLYFAYEETLAVGDQTPALFDAVKLTGTADAVTTYLIQKHFVKTDGTILVPGEDGIYTEKPHMVDGEYVYKYTVIDESVSGNAKYVVLNQDDTYELSDEEYIYGAYNEALAAVDAMEALNDDNTVKFNMDIRAAAIQSVNEENENWIAVNTEQWYPQLPAEF